MSTWNQVVLEVNLWIKLRVLAELLTYPQESVLWINKIGVKIETGKEQLRFWSRRSSKLNIVKIQNKRVKIESRNLEQWIEAKRSEPTIILKIESLITELDSLCSALRTWCRESTFRSSSTLTKKKFMRRNSKRSSNSSKTNRTKRQINWTELSFEFWEICVSFYSFYLFVMTKCLTFSSNH